MMTQSNGRSLNSPHGRDFTYYDGMGDQELARFLRRIEDRIYSYAGDVMDGWLGMAGQFSQAKARLATGGRTGRWIEWVEARFRGFISTGTANKLAELGERSRDELMELRSTIFTSGTGIHAIA